ncbi:MAG: hypothetical protein NTV61_11280 [Candidatus Bathyarchaeota archaeon]|nr:hypothetical protein [Candidatus Bathyarchaeota archaeon]
MINICVLVTPTRTLGTCHLTPKALTSRTPTIGTLLSSVATGKFTKLPKRLTKKKAPTMYAGRPRTETSRSPSKRKTRETTQTNASSSINR